MCGPHLDFEWTERAFSQTQESKNEGWKHSTFHKNATTTLENDPVSNFPTRNKKPLCDMHFGVFY